MKTIYLFILINLSLAKAVPKTKRVHRNAPERDLLIFDSQKDVLKRQLEKNQHENTIMMMKMMKR